MRRRKLARGKLSRFVFVFHTTLVPRSSFDDCLRSVDTSFSGLLAGEPAPSSDVLIFMHSRKKLRKDGER